MTPFESNKQRKYLFAKKPDVAKKFAKHMGKSKKKHSVGKAMRDALKS